MTINYPETDYENFVIELFKNIGYKRIYGHDIGTRNFYSALKRRDVIGIRFEGEMNFHIYK